MKKYLIMKSKSGPRKIQGDTREAADQSAGCFWCPVMRPNIESCEASERLSAVFDTTS